MAHFSVKNLVLSTVIASSTLAVCAATAVRPPPGLPITLDAQSVDTLNNNAVFRKVRLSRGTMSISADFGQIQGQSKKARPNGGLDFNFDDSQWQFRGNVKITLDQGQLTADDAQINFRSQQLSKAVANGKPATFEEHSGMPGKLVHGRADIIAYDAGRGIVELSRNAFLTRGTSEEVRSESLRYNIPAQTIAGGSPDASAGPDGDTDKVHLVFPPPPVKP